MLEIAILLSLRITIRFLFKCPAWLRASSDIPAPIAASPTTAIIFLSMPFILSAQEIPRAAEIACPLWPQVNGSYSLSFLSGKPLNPLYCLKVGNAFLLPVSNLCTYVWCPTSQINLSLRKSNVRCRAIVSSTTPRFDDRWPGFLETTSIISSLISCAKTAKSSASSCCKSCGSLFFLIFL